MRKIFSSKFEFKAFFDIVLWILVTVLNLQGFLLDREFAIWAIVSAFFAYLVIKFFDNADESDNASYIFIVSGITVIAYGLTGSTGWCIWIFVVLFVLANWQEYDLYACVFLLALIACFICWLVPKVDSDKDYGQTTYVTTKKTLDFYKSNVINNNLFSKADKSTLLDPAKAEAVFWQTVAEYEQNAALVCARKDSLFTIFVHKKEADFAIVDKKLSGRTDVLTIKRLWINSDVLPWTYEGWSKVELQLRGRYFVMGGSFSASLEANGEAKYMGETRLDYVNVVFNDNSFKQFLVKDDPRWLLAREGDKVKVLYMKRKPDGIHLSYLSDVDNNYQRRDDDFLYEKKYEPLLKK